MAMDLTQVDLAMDEYWKLHPAKAQFHRLGNTSKWFRPKGEVFKGKRYNFKAYTTPLSNVRTSDFDTAAAIDKEFPAGRQLEYTELSYDRSDLTMFQGTLEINELAGEVTTDQKHAVYNLVTKMFREADLDFGHKFNLGIHQSSACQMATVAAQYATTGAVYSSNRRCYIQVTSDQIGKFMPGEIIDVGASDVDVTILDVIHGRDGPFPEGGGTRVTGIGPGLVCDIGSGNTFTTLTAGDIITRSDETTGDGLNGFADWFSGTANVFNDADGTAIDRDLYGNAWGIPILERIAAEGSEVEIDLDEHLGVIADVWPQAVEWGRNSRMGETSEDDILLPSVLVAVGPIDLINAVMVEGEDTQRFTKATDLTADRRTELFGHVGFDGLMYHSAVLPPIAFQADGAAAKFKLRILDPQSWGFINLSAGAGMYGIEWLKSGGAQGTRWMRVLGSNGRPTFQLAAAAYSAALMYCDQPLANAELSGVKSYR